MVGTLQSEAVIRAQILLFGENSELVVHNRLAAEREALAAQMEAKGVAADHAANVLEAWDAAKGFNAEAAGMSGFLSAAASEAARMAGNIWGAVTAMAAVKSAANEKLAQMAVEFSPGGQAMMKYGSRTPGGTSPQKALELRNQPAKTRPGRGSASRGGGTSEIDKQRKALDSLIEREERELALLRETDPVQKEMLRHRDAMAGATEAERAKAEELITSQIRLKQEMETMEWASEQAGGTLVDALMGAKGAGEQLIQTLKRAALEALILGKGPLTGLFGGRGGGLLGGLVESIFGGGAPVKLATGGMIHGPGSGTSDDVPILASNGEFMMNAKATARYRHLLEAMNSGAPIPGFANGGAIGGGSRLASAPGGDTMQVAIDLRGAQGDKSIEEKAFKAMKAALDEWDRKVFPRRMQALRSDPRRIG